MLLLLQSVTDDPASGLLILYVAALAILTFQKVSLYRELKSKAWFFVASGWATWAIAVLLVILKVIESRTYLNRSIWLVGFILMIIGNHLLHRDLVRLRHRREGSQATSKGRWE